MNLTQRTLDEEDEKADSDTDDTDCREESHEEPEFQDFMQDSMAQYWKRNNKVSRSPKVCNCEGTTLSADWGYYKEQFCSE